jgi:hypothetical protein
MAILIAKGGDVMSVEDKKHRSHLPIATPERTGFMAYDAKDPDSKFPPIEQLRPPKGAPNVLIILIDDAGFGSASAFGGPCLTPSAEKLAAGGLKYNRFHTTALCSPSRQALLTGRNHHSAGMGGITEIATGAPGYNSVLPNTISPLARTLKLNGYSTAQFGKCHEVPVWETSPVGPFDAWPTGGGGFEYFSEVIRLDRRAVRRRFEERFSSRRMANDYAEVYRRLGRGAKLVPDRAASALGPNIIPLHRSSRGEHRASS